MQTEVRSDKKRPIGMFSLGLVGLLGMALMQQGRAQAQAPDSIYGPEAQQEGPPIGMPAARTVVDAVSPQDRSATSAPVFIDTRTIKASTADDSRPPLQPITGHVRGAGTGYAVIDVGRGAGVKEGQHFRLSEPDKRTLADRTPPHTVVGIVTAVEDGGARVELGMNEYARPGYLAQLSGEKLTGDRRTPPHPQRTGELSVVARPFLPLDDFGVGVLLDAQAAVEVLGYLRLELNLAPFGVATGQDDDLLTYQAYGTLSYSHRYFALGMGLGAQSMLSPRHNLYDGELAAKNATLLVQQARFGTVDGVHFRVTTSISLQSQLFELASVRGAAQFPLADHLWLIMRGGGGTAGYGFGEAGVRVLLQGNGNAASTFISFTGGGSAIIRDRLAFVPTPESNFDDIANAYTLAGPHIGVGLEQRL